MALPKYETAIAQRSKAIKENREVIRKLLSKLAENHRGQYALVRHKDIQGYYDSAWDALQAAMRLYPDDAAYSVEKIEPEPIYMGMRADVVVSSRS